MEKVSKRLLEELQELQQRGQNRCLVCRDGSLVDFTSNDYLGLARGVQSENSSDSGGAGGSRLLSGTSSIMLETEAFLAERYHCEQTLIFSSGYQANIGLLSAICRKGDFILYDSLVHASIRDAVRLTFSRSASFEHNSLSSLEQKLQRTVSTVPGLVFVCVESLYSMDGDIAPLQQMAAMCAHYGAALVVDEAHSTGVYGTDGAGLICELALEEAVFARVHTFGKAVGLHGACIAGSGLLTQIIVNKSRPFIYTTAPAPGFFRQIRLAHEAVARAADQRQGLLELATYANEIATEMNIRFVSDDSAIKAVLVPGNQRCMQVAAAIRTKGFDVRAIRSPTVAEGAERIRICIHAFNTRSEIRVLLEEMAALLEYS